MERNEIEKSKQGQYLTFQLRSEIFGMPIEDVREINQYVEVTPVPHAPESIKGVMNLRGKIVPVVNLRLRFGMKEQELTRDSCIIVIETGIGQVGLIVDSVREVISLGDTQIENAPTLTSDSGANYIRGMAKVDSMVIILVELNLAFEARDFSKLQDAA